MNVAMITMDRDVAREKLRAYRAAKHRDAEEQYRQCEAAYRALAKGTPLIRLSQAIQQGGFFPDEWRPRLAIARADRQEVRFRWRHGRSIATFDTMNQWRSRPGSLEIRVDMGQVQQHRRWIQHRQCYLPLDSIGFALVPMVPADVRPQTGQLRDWFILWEVERWADQSRTGKAPTDPMLLKHLGGDLYAVLAQWDLTEVERAILDGAMRS